ncbi:MAG: DUF3299 domain-containing protein [Gemmataceae bacterium]
MSRWLLGLLFFPSLLQAGLHYSGETFAPLPAHPAGFLRDHRTLLQIRRIKSPSALRIRYLAEAQRLRKKGRLSADEAADLGALHLRMGEVAEALAVLRPAQRVDPRHFRLTAHLALAHQQAGELALAVAHQEQVVRLAPAEWRSAEMLHLHWMRQRLRQKDDTLDNLFNVDYADPTHLKKLPVDALANVQVLLLWVPEDGRLLWQLAELLGANGDQTTRAAILEGCVSEFEMRQPELLQARKAARALSLGTVAIAPLNKKAHESHSQRFAYRSPRPLIHRAVLDHLPAIDKRAINPMPWELLNETLVDRHGRPQFHSHLRRLDGLQVSLWGYMQPLGDGSDGTVFLLIENPVGCWYCENPQLVQIVLVELPEGRTQRLTRDPLQVIGTLSLNATDPENFFFTLRADKITPLPSE